MTIARCPVCCDDTSNVTVGCQRCQTPHHAECWGLMGECAVYGCQGQVLGPVTPQVSALPLVLDGTVESGPEPVTEQRLRRGVGKRLGEAIRFLATNWRLAAALAAMGLGTELTAKMCNVPVLATGEPNPAVVFALGLLRLIGQAMAPVLLVAILGARARGKELPVEECLRAIPGRLMRTVTTSMWVSLYIGAWAGLAGALCAGVGFLAPKFAVPGLMPGIVLLPLACWQANAYMLAIPVAAMGEREEPGDPVRRSAALVALAPWQVLAGNALLIASWVVAVTLGTLASHVCAGWGASFVLVVVGDLLRLLATAYAVILYFELRRILPAKPEACGAARDQAEGRAAGRASLAASLWVLGWCLWTSIALVQDYAIGFGFGWGAALTFLLPLPFAWLVGRRVLRRGARSVMRRMTAGFGIACVPLAVFWMAVGGFAFSFTLTFLQGLVSWFMTPAPTLLLELYMDVTNALQAGMHAGLVATVAWAALVLFRPRE